MPIETIVALIRKQPGSTATQIAEGLYGFEGYHQRVSNTLRLLCAVGRIERRGGGGPGEPYRYYALQEGAPGTPGTGGGDGALSDG
jgi:hypothetical protein